MGKIHAKYLRRYSWFDPLVTGGLSDLSGLGQFSHIIVASPTDTHYQIWMQLAEFEGRILLEKPVVVDWSQLHIFSDRRLFCGMVERYNPVTAALKRLLIGRQIRRMVFTRAAAVVSEVAIHDLDLLLELLDAPCFIRLCGPRQAVAESPGCVARFDWPRSPLGCRTLEIDLGSEQLHIDFVAQTINGVQYYGSPIANEHAAFFGGEECNAAASHTLLLQLGL